MRLLSFVKITPSYVTDVLVGLFKGNNQINFCQVQPYRQKVVYEYNGAFLHSIFTWTGQKVKRRPGQVIMSLQNKSVVFSACILTKIQLTRIFPCSILLNTDDMHKIG